MPTINSGHGSYRGSELLPPRGLANIYVGQQPARRPLANDTALLSPHRYQVWRRFRLFGQVPGKNKLMTGSRLQPLSRVENPGFPREPASVPKLTLVSRLQALLHEGRLK